MEFQNVHGIIRCEDEVSGVAFQFGIVVIGSVRLSDEKVRQHAQPCGSARDIDGPLARVSRPRKDSEGAGNGRSLIQKHVFDGFHGNNWVVGRNIVHNFPRRKGEFYALAWDALTRTHFRSGVFTPQIIDLLSVFMAAQYLGLSKSLGHSLKYFRKALICGKATAHDDIEIFQRDFTDKIGLIKNHIKYAADGKRSMMRFAAQKTVNLSRRRSS